MHSFFNLALREDECEAGQESSQHLRHAVHTLEGRLCQRIAVGWKCHLSRSAS